MRYLKRFNESLIEENIREFCEERLVAITDKGYYVHVYEYGDGVTEISIGRGSYGDNSDNFKWSDVKDDFIPFIEILDGEYIITNGEGVLPEFIKFAGDIKHNYSTRYNVQDILDDNVAENLVFTTIVFYVKGKK